MNPIKTKELAQALNVSENCVRMNGHKLGGRKKLGRWEFDAETALQRAYDDPHGGDKCHPPSSRP